MELQSLSSKKKRFPCKYEEDHSHRRIRALAKVCYEELMKDYGHLVSTPVDVAEVFHDRKSDLKMDKIARKRRRTTESEAQQSKKRKPSDGVVVGPSPPRPIPQAMSDVIRSSGHDHQQVPVLVIQKKLFQADIEAQQNRLSMPLNQISSDGFLSEAEKKKVGHKGLDVRFIEPSMKENCLKLRKWCYKKKKKNMSVFSYVFNKNWYDVVENNRLKVGDIVQVWFSRGKDGNPCIAMVNLGVGED